MTETSTMSIPSEAAAGDAAVRVIAFYLPQYHPIPENDEWWGPGFTEWTNTAKARPRFRGHYQPRIPGELGYYDLRLAETREAQAQLAQTYGVEGFCYYHYWFAGKQLLERPLKEVVAFREPRLPFCVCWANGTWTGIWHGAPKRVLIEQTYPGEADDRRHFDTLRATFADPRYIRVEGRLLFVVHQPTEIPEPKRFTDLWRNLAARAGLPDFHFSAVTHTLDWDPLAHGFDTRIPNHLPPVRIWYPWSQPLLKITTAIRQRRGIPTVYPYEDAVRLMFPPGMMKTPSFPCVVPNWDNTARSGRRGRVLHGSTPAKFATHLRDAIDLLRDVPASRRIVFVKSWNEWAEGNYLEPDRTFGRQYLEAMALALKESRTTRP